MKKVKIRSFHQMREIHYTLQYFGLNEGLKNMLDGDFYEIR